VTYREFRKKEDMAKFRAEIKAVIALNPGCDSRQVHAIAGGEFYSVLNQLRVLREKNEIVLTGVPRKYKYFIAGEADPKDIAKIEGKDLLPIKRKFVPQSEWCKA
jgi:hypothetical protein